MMRINLLPESERATPHAVQSSTLFLIVSMVLLTVMSLATAYLRWQVISEREQQAGYQATISTLAKYRSETNQLQQEIRQLNEMLRPLEERLKSMESPVDMALVFSRIVASARAGNVWLHELAIEKDGAIPISGYAVEFSEVSRFLSALGQPPLSVVMGSTHWVERDGVRVLEFSAEVKPLKGDK